MVRFRRMELGPYIVLQRFVDDPESQIEVVDARTVRFTMTRSEPLFLAAMASSYGPYVVSTKLGRKTQPTTIPGAMSSSALKPSAPEPTVSSKTILSSGSALRSSRSITVAGMVRISLK